MATILKNTVIKNCGTVPVLIYETLPTTRVTILGLSFTNLTDQFIYCDVLIKDDTSVTGYYLKDSIIKNGLDPDNLETNEKGFNISGSQDKINAWKDIWSAGQGVGFSKEIQSLEEIAIALEKEWKILK